MLGTLIGKKKDREARIRHAIGAWAKVKKWLWKSKLSKRTRALVVQAVVELSLLFDCNARPWTVGDLNRFQSMVDRFHRYIWNNGKGLPLVRMQKEGVNGYEVRRQLGITSIRSKVEIRALERIGHVLRMPNERMTKKVVLGRWLEEKTENGKLTGGLIAYWKRLIGEAGEDWTNIENLTKNRKTWKTLINNRKANLTRWETDMCDHTRGHTKPTRSQTRVVEDGFSCRWTFCDKICRSKAGLVQHERRMHRETTLEFACPKCKTTFKEKSSQTNHTKACGGAPRGVCSDCGKSVSVSNMARHRKTNCRNAPINRNNETTIIRTREYKQYDKCGAWITKSNLARHKNVSCTGNTRQGST